MILAEFIRKNITNPVSTPGIYNANTRNQAEEETSLANIRGNKMPFIITFKYAIFLLGIALATYEGIQFLRKKKRENLIRDARTREAVRREYAEFDDRFYEDIRYVEKVHLERGERLAETDIELSETATDDAERQILRMNILFKGISGTARHISPLRKYDEISQKIIDFSEKANLFFSNYSKEPSGDFAQKLALNLEELRLGVSELALKEVDDRLLELIKPATHNVYERIVDILKRLSEHQIELGRAQKLKIKLRLIVCEFIKEVTVGLAGNNRYLSDLEQLNNTLNNCSFKDLSRISLEIIKAKTSWSPLLKQDGGSEEVTMILSSLTYGRVFGEKALLNLVPKHSRVSKYIKKEEQQFKTFIKLIIAWSKERWAAYGPLALNFKDGIAERLWLWCLPVPLEERQKRLTELLDPATREEALNWFKSYLEGTFFEDDETFGFDDEKLLKTAGLQVIKENILNTKLEADIRGSLIEVDEELVCPLTRSLIEIPVRIGPHLYNQATALIWYLIKNTDPLTRDTIEPKSLMIDLAALQKLQLYLLEQWKLKQNKELESFSGPIQISKLYLASHSLEKDNTMISAESKRELTAAAALRRVANLSGTPILK